MTTRLEHDYIGLSEIVSSMEKGSDKSSTNNGGLNLKATELRLGLPGSESPQRGDSTATLSLHKISSSISGAKRGFSDAIIGASSKWAFSGNGGSEPTHDLGKNGGGLFSQRGDANEGKTTAQQQSGSEVKKDGGVSQPSPKSILHDKKPQNSTPASKAQVVGWPPIRSFRKNSMAPHSPKDNNEAENKVVPGCLYIKVSMDGAPYLRKIDLKTYGSYVKLSSALEKMFSCFTIGQCGSPEGPSREGLSESWLMDLLHGSEYVLTYEDKDGDWMLVGDVPWEMFIDSCKRMRIMKSSEAVGLAPRAMEKCKNRN